MSLAAWQQNFAGRPAELERRPSAHGELLLRRVDDQLELILNGVFLMSTRDGASERALAREAIAGQPRTSLLIAGLGAGFSLAEALGSPAVQEVAVVEAEPDVISWNRTYFRRYNNDALSDPRVTVVCCDIRDYVAGCAQRCFDAICLDTDNGPGWLSRPANATLYTRRGLEQLRGLLRAGGRLAVWSAHEDGSFADRLAAVFGTVEVKAFPVERGPDDLVYLASLRRARHVAPLGTPPCSRAQTLGATCD